MAKHFTFNFKLVAKSFKYMCHVLLEVTDKHKNHQDENQTDASITSFSSQEKARRSLKFSLLKVLIHIGKRETGL